MAAVLKLMYKGYFWIFDDLSDPRADDLLLMRSPFIPLGICATYLFIILKVLPSFMKNRPAYNLDKILIVFNLSQVLVNLYLFYYAVIEVQKFSWFCQPIDFSTTEHNIFVVRLVYLYFVTKVADLLDTIFFILRKKENQVTFLHCYHHFGMVAITWIAVRFIAGGQSIFVGIANSFVHIIMYFYYLLTIWRPAYKKNIWWKKYITQLQLGQFVFFLFIYAPLFFQPNCQYPKIVPLFIVPQNIFMICLFGDFYWKAYVKPKQNKKN